MSVRPFHQVFPEENNDFQGISNDDEKFSRCLDPLLAFCKCFKRAGEKNGSF
jgi:hypothetical protein